jgi:putative peptidoglycan lipid II flippase
VVLAEPIIRLLFERGEFGADATLRAALALACLSPGLVAFSMVNILGRAFYALGDTHTPMRISVFCLVLNALLVFALVWRFRQGGLGLANTLSASCNVALLLYALRRKLAKLDLTPLWKQLPGLLGSAIVAGVVAWGLAKLWSVRLGHASLLLRAGEVFLPMIAATLAYFALTAWLNVGSAREMFGLLRAKLGPRRA